MTQIIELDRGVLEKLMSITDEKLLNNASFTKSPIVQVINIQNIAKSSILKYKEEKKKDSQINVDEDDDDDDDDVDNDEDLKETGYLTSSVDRYLLILSDGEYFETRCLLLPNLNYQVRSAKLRKGSIVRLDRYELNQIPNAGKIIIIDQLTVLKNTIKKSVSAAMSDERKSIMNNSLLADTFAAIGIIGLPKPTSNNKKLDTVNKSKEQLDLNRSNSQYKQQYELIEFKFKQIMNQDEKKIDKNNNKELVLDKKNEDEEDLNYEDEDGEEYEDDEEEGEDDLIGESEDDEEREEDDEDEYDDDEDDDEDDDDDDEEEICECTNCQDKNTIKLCYRIMDLNEKATKAQVKEKYLSLINSNFSNANGKSKNESKNENLSNAGSAEFNLNKLIKSMNKNFLTKTLTISDSDRLEITTKAYNLIMGIKSDESFDDERDEVLVASDKTTTTTTTNLNSADINKKKPPQISNSEKLNFDSKKTPQNAEKKSVDQRLLSQSKETSLNKNKPQIDNQTSNEQKVNFSNTSNSSSSGSNGSSLAPNLIGEKKNYKNRLPNKIGDVRIKDYLQYAWMRAADEFILQEAPAAERLSELTELNNTNPTQPKISPTASTQTSITQTKTDDTKPKPKRFPDPNLIPPNPAPQIDEKQFFSQPQQQQQQHNCNSSTTSSNSHTSHQHLHAASNSTRRKINRNPKAFYQQIKKSNKTQSLKAMRGSKQSKPSHLDQLSQLSSNLSAPIFNYHTAPQQQQQANSLFNLRANNFLSNIEKSSKSVESRSTSSSSTTSSSSSKPDIVDSSSSSSIKQQIEKELETQLDEKQSKKRKNDQVTTLANIKENQPLNIDKKKRRKRRRKS